MGLDEFMRDRLIEREETQEKTARCCQYGYFGDGHKCAKEQPVGDVAEPPLRVRGGNLQNFKDACTAPISQESAKKMVQLAIAEALADLTEDEWVHINVFDDSEFGGYLQKFLAYRRARLAQADKPRTKQERVEAILLKEYGHIIKQGHELTAAEIIAELEKAQ
jgi:hypothetical protein